MHSLWIIFLQITLLWELLIFYNNGFTAGGSELSKCEIRANFTSPYIVASYRSLVPGIGCEANVSTVSGQDKQVHVITVEPPVMSSDVQSGTSRHQGRHTVHLAISSRAGRNLTGLSPSDVFVEDTRPMVFVLSSPVPVTWKVGLHGIDYDGPELHQFIISTDSRIKLKRKNRRKCNSSNMAVPTGSDAAERVNDKQSRLLWWAEQKFGTMSSFSSVKGRAVQFYTGRDSSAGPRCEDTALKTSQRVFSHQEDPVALIGCHSEDVGKTLTSRSFILELLEPPPLSPGIDGLDVDIEAYEERSSHPAMLNAVGRSGRLLRELALRNTGLGKEVDFDLVIKSPENLKWKLHSRSISKRIGIVSNSQDVKTNGIKILEMGFREEVIQGSGQDLVQWTNIFVSTTWLYVGARGANTFRLRVPPIDHKMSGGRNSVRKAAGMFGTGPGNTKGVNRDVTPRAGAWPGVADSDQPTWSGHVQATGQGNVVSARCYNTTMEVKLSKSFVETHKLDPSKMFLGKLDCGMTAETDTSVVFRVPLSQCGIVSSEIVASKKRVHKSVLFIKTPPGLRLQLLTEEVGSGYMKDGGRDPDPEIDGEEDTGDRGSGLQDPDFDGTNDDEDYSAPDDPRDFDQDNITFNVECEQYINPPSFTQTPMKGFKGPPKGTYTKTKTSSQFGPHVTMLVSDNGWLDKAVSTVPVEISPSKPVYIKAKLKYKDATLLTDSCWFSRSENPFNITALPTFFIKQGCNFGVRGMEWMDDPLNGAENTNFRTSHFRLQSSLLQEVLPQDYGTPLHWFLHCEYRDCQRTDLSQALECPVLPENRCKLYESRSLLMYPTFYWGPLTLGPFIINNGARNTIGTRPSSKNQWFFNNRSSFNKDRGHIGGSTDTGDPIVVGVGTGVNRKSTASNDRNEGQQAAPPQQLIIMEGLDPFLAVGIAFATFVLGIVLVAAIWCIHTRTGEHHLSSSSSSSSSSSQSTSPSSFCGLCPVKSRPAGTVSVEGSGDHTPNSSSPMTA